MTTAIVISAEDNVATALEAIERGQTVHAGGATVTATEAIPRGHKIALRAIAAGDRVIKYGSPIGSASQAIAAGAHVHTHNVASTRGRGDLCRHSDGLSRPSADLSRHSAEGATAEGATQAARLAEPPE
jgi:altronate dehydratase